MNTYEEQPLYLVSDIETSLVYAQVPSPAAAAAVTLGILNSYSYSLPIHLPNRKTEWDAYDFNKDLYQTLPKFKFRKFPKELIRDDLLKKRKLARLRGYHFYCMEVYCEGALGRVAEYMPDELAAFMYSELAKCEPSRNVFTRPIEEYAALQEIDVGVAYQELQQRLHTRGEIELRNYAIHQKYVMKMNLCQTKRELNRVLQQATLALRGSPQTELDQVPLKI